MEAPKVKLNRNTFLRQRNRILSEINSVDQLIEVAAPPVVQELIIAKRSLEDARMRVGVAMGYATGSPQFQMEHVDVAEDEEGEA